MLKLIILLITYLFATTQCRYISKAPEKHLRHHGRSYIYYLVVQKAAHDLNPFSQENVVSNNIKDNLESSKDGPISIPDFHNSPRGHENVRVILKDPPIEFNPYLPDDWKEMTKNDSQTPIPTTVSFSTRSTPLAETVTITHNMENTEAGESPTSDDEIKDATTDAVEEEDITTRDYVETSETTDYSLKENVSYVTTSLSEEEKTVIDAEEISTESTVEISTSADSGDEDESTQETVTTSIVIISETMTYPSSEKEDIFTATDAGDLSTRTTLETAKSAITVSGIADVTIPTTHLPEDFISSSDDTFEDDEDFGDFTTATNSQSTYEPLGDHSGDDDEKSKTTPNGPTRGREERSENPISSGSVSGDGEIREKKGSGDGFTDDEDFEVTTLTNPPTTMSSQSKTSVEIFSGSGSGDGEEDEEAETFKSIPPSTTSVTVLPETPSADIEDEEDYDEDTYFEEDVTSTSSPHLLTTTYTSVENEATTAIPESPSRPILTQPQTTVITTSESSVDSEDFDGSGSGDGLGIDDDEDHPTEKSRHLRKITRSSHIINSHTPPSTSAAKPVVGEDDQDILFEESTVSNKKAFNYNKSDEAFENSTTISTRGSLVAISVIPNNIDNLKETSKKGKETDKSVNDDDYEYFVILDSELEQK